MSLHRHIPRRRPAAPRRFWALMLTAMLAGAGTGSAAQTDPPEPRFADISDRLPGPQIYGGGWEFFVGGGVAVFDCDGDARPDIFAAGGENPAVLWRNTTGPEGRIGFVNAPLPGETTGVTGGYALDVDSDGIRDLVLLRVEANRLLRGLGGCRFEPAPAAWNFPGGSAWTTAFSATWEPGNDWPTLAFGNYVDRDDPEGPFGACDANGLLRPAGPGRAGFGPLLRLEPGFCALSMLFSDWRRQGRADLRVSNDRHYYVRGGSEQMWRMAPLRLLDAEDGWEEISIWGMGIASRDINGDGRPEVMLTSMGDQLLMMSGPEGYRRAPFSTGSYAQRPYLGDDGRPSTGWHAEFADVNNDGRADLFIAKGNVDQMPSNAMRDPNNLLIQQPDGRFAERGDRAGVASVERARGAALADLDGDGRLDLVVANRRAPLEIYRNETPQAGGWLAVEPRQRGMNRFAVGAWVELRRPGSAEPWQSQEVTVGGGHAGGSAGPLHFGLGGLAAAEVRVIWPSGETSQWLRLESGTQAALWPAEGAEGAGGGQLAALPLVP